jgi:hypothetical protein
MEKFVTQAGVTAVRPRKPDPILLVIVLAFLATLEPAYAAAQQGTPDVPTIIANMVRAQAENRAHMHAYMINRTYQVYGGEAKEKPKSEVLANIQFLPPNQKSYSIEQSSGGTAEHVVRKALEKEVELAKKPSVTAMNGENYDFGLIGEQALNGKPTWVLSIQPRHSCKELLKGKIWVDKETYLVRRVDGELSKTPSWWVRNVHLVITFAENSGMWLQTSQVAKANLRIAGVFTLVSRDEVVASENMARASYQMPVARSQRSGR